MVLCEKINEDFSNIINPFDNLNMKIDEYLPFEIAVFIGYDIEKATKVSFILGMHYEDKYKMIAVTERNMPKGIWREAVKYTMEEFEPIGEGAYIIELRYVENVSFDKEDVTDSDVLEILHKTKTLNSYIFNVTSIN